MPAHLFAVQALADAAIEGFAAEKCHNMTTFCIPFVYA